jgi:hypothetical protein
MESSSAFTAHEVAALAARFARQRGARGDFHVKSVWYR